MSEARQCDRCNKFYSLNDTIDERGEYSITTTYKKRVGSMTLYYNNVNRIMHLDLCPACSRSLIVWLNDWGQYEEVEKEEDITVKLEYGECPYFKSESSGLMCKQSSTCDGPCKDVDLYNMQKVKVTDKIDHVNCPYRKDVVCASNKDKNCVMCDVYKQIFGEEDKECSKEENTSST